MANRLQQPREQLKGTANCIAPRDSLCAVVTDEEAVIPEKHIIMPSQHAPLCACYGKGALLHSPVIYYNGRRAAEPARRPVLGNEGYINSPCQGCDWSLVEIGEATDHKRDKSVVKPDGLWFVSYQHDCFRQKSLCSLCLVLERGGGYGVRHEDNPLICNPCHEPSIWAGQCIPLPTGTPVGSSAVQMVCSD